MKKNNIINVLGILVETVTVVVSGASIIKYIDNIRSGDAEPDAKNTKNKKKVKK